VTFGTVLEQTLQKFQKQRDKVLGKALREWFSSPTREDQFAIAQWG
jgi:hypothetical protein